MKNSIYLVTLDTVFDYSQELEILFLSGGAIS